MKLKIATLIDDLLHEFNALKDDEKTSRVNWHDIAKVDEIKMNNYSNLIRQTSALH
jgi:hypothetical protein